MKTSLSARARVAIVLGIFAGLPGLSCAASAQPAEQSSTAPSATKPQSAEEIRARADWQKAIAQVPLPKTKGCFTASYPNRTWQEHPCTAPSPYPNRPHMGGPRSNAVGAGTDYEAVVTGQISSAVGSFDSVMPTTITESGPVGGHPPAAANAFTLQLNTQFFPNPPACNGHSGCLGWQQFIYSGTQCSGGPCVFIEYWMLNYGTCPGSPWIQSGSDCWYNSASSAPLLQTTAADLQNVTLTGSASAASDSVVLTSPAGNATATAVVSVLDLSQFWNTTEFNLFGDCCSTQASFSTPATVVVRTTIHNGTTNAPNCMIGGTTAETNNLNLVGTTALPIQPSPTMVFTQSSSTGAPSCAAAQGIGDTHLTTFSGAHYDFQATGDFLLAEAGSGFVVENRQVSGAPSWPNADVNTAVATQMGRDRIAVCLSQEPLFIDGKHRDLADGASIALSGGTFVSRSGDSYLITGESGDSVIANVNIYPPGTTSHIDAYVGLGRWPQANVHGLLASANGNVNEIQTRQGAVLQEPVSFAQLYGQYGDSWRVPSKESLLSPCGTRKIERGNPQQPFYAADLDPKIYERTRAICVEAGVTQGPHLDDCTLDVAVIGSPRAAKVFVGEAPPAAVWQAGARKSPVRKGYDDNR
jgi:hypothetical protein